MTYVKELGANVPFGAIVQAHNRFCHEESVPPITEREAVLKEYMLTNGFAFAWESYLFQLKGNRHCWVDITGEEESVRLRAIWVPPRLRERGFGKTMMVNLCQSADATLVPIFLCVRVFDMVDGELVADKQSPGGLTESKLQKWYEGFGFRTINDSTTTKVSMMRVPQ